MSFSEYDRKILQDLTRILCEIREMVAESLEVQKEQLKVLEGD